MHTMQTRADAHICGSHLKKHILKTDINIGRQVFTVILPYVAILTKPKIQCNLTLNPAHIHMRLFIRRTTPCVHEKHGGGRVVRRCRVSRVTGASK